MYYDKITAGLSACGQKAEEAWSTETVVLTHPISYLVWHAVPQEYDHGPDPMNGQVVSYQANRDGTPRWNEGCNIEHESAWWRLCPNRTR